MHQPLRQARNTQKNILVWIISFFLNNAHTDDLLCNLNLRDSLREMIKSRVLNVRLFFIISSTRDLENRVFHF